MGHRSQDERLPSGYDAPVIGRVVTKRVQGTGHRTSGYQVATRYRSHGEWLPSGCETKAKIMMLSEVATRHRLQDEWLPSGYEAPVTGRVFRKWFQCTGHMTETLPSCYESPVTEQVLSKCLRGTGQKTSDF